MNIKDSFVELIAGKLIECILTAPGSAQTVEQAAQKQCLLPGQHPEGSGSSLSRPEVTRAESVEESAISHSVIRTA